MNISSFNKVDGFHAKHTGGPGGSEAPFLKTIISLVQIGLEYLGNRNAGSFYYWLN